MLGLRGALPWFTTGLGLKVARSGRASARDLLKAIKSVAANGEVPEAASGDVGVFFEHFPRQTSAFTRMSF